MSSVPKLSAYRANREMAGFDTRDQIRENTAPQDLCETKKDRSVWFATRDLLETVLAVA